MCYVSKIAHMFKRRCRESIYIILCSNEFNRLVELKLLKNYTIKRRYTIKLIRFVKFI